MRSGCSRMGVWGTNEKEATSAETREGHSRQRQQKCADSLTVYMTQNRGQCSGDRLEERASVMCGEL